MSPLSPSISLQDATRVRWDVIIIGAGVAGGSCAYLLGRAGVKTLLVDKASFPRAKVCGCCINNSAIHSLEAMGLGDLLTAHHAIPLTQLHLTARGRTATISAAMGLSLSRSALDAAIITRAMEHGASFLSGVTAQLEPIDHEVHHVSLRSGDEHVRASTRIVIVADGLGGRSLESSSSLDVQVSAHSHMGIATIIDHPSDICSKHAVMMACGQAGYVGMVRLEDDQLNIACALAPAFVKAQGGPAQAVIATLRDAGIPFAETTAAAFHQATWMGTPLLTRRRSVPAGERLFVLGDAAGYVEPITGEGMAWALRGASLLAPVAQQAASQWHDSHAAQWQDIHRGMISQRQRSCRAVSSILRSPLLTTLMLAGARLCPGIAGRFIERMHAPLPTGAGSCR